MFLTLVQSSLLVRKTVCSTVVVFLAFTAAYVPLWFWLGYSYELHVVSTVVFASIGVLVPMGLFGGYLGDFEDAGTVKVVFGGLVVAVLVEELLLNSVLAAYGFAFSVLALVLLPVLAVLYGRDNSWLRVALEAVALIFATRVVLSPFSLEFFTLPVFLPVIYTLILIALVLYLTYRRIRAGEIRIRLDRHSFGFQVGAALGVGVALGLTEYVVLKPQPILLGTGFVQMLAYIVVVMIMVAVVEEILFRGLLQTPLEKVMPNWQAIGVCSVMFGLMHVGWMNPLEVLLAYGAGVVFGYMTTATESLTAPIVAHGVGNLVLYMIAFYLQ